jgi:SAM-dependent methyltransferase
VHARATRDVWATEFTATALAHWTAERTRALTGGKRLAIVPAEAPLLLRSLGLLHRDATMPPAQVRKFLQINHVVRVLESAMATLRARHQVVRILDAGCGRSYLTLLLAWVAREHWQHRVEVLGIDRNPDVIEECRRRTAIAELDEVVQFRAAALEDVAGEHAHAVFALHACDTATDDAIVLGVRTAAELIAVAPCCQAELARGWSELPAGGPFAPIHQAPHLRHEIAAHVTDAMRMLLLRAAGYAVTPMEFIAAEHTKKNTLLRALRTEPDPGARADYAALVAATGGAGIALAARL